MEFLLYLSPQGQQLVNDLISAQFKFQENTQLCRNEPNVFGYVKNSKQFVICTSNIKRGGWSLKHYVNETVYHESVHAAQICKGGFLSAFFPPTLGISKKSMPLSSDKLDEIEQSASIFGIGSRDREHEAYYLENKPQKVINYVKKYCF
jgi:hypothetical protein